jgi:N-methylhydantoinase B
LIGDDVFHSAMEAMLERNRRAMSESIRRTVPESKQYFEDYVCDDGLGMGSYKIACSSTTASTSSWTYAYPRARCSSR